MPVEMKREGRGRAADEVEAMLPSDGTWKTFTFFTPPLYVFVQAGPSRGLKGVRS